MNPPNQLQRCQRKLLTLTVRIVSVLVFLSVFVLPLVAQDVQMNQPDHASATQGNYTVQSETNHVVTRNGIIAAWNDASQIATFGTMYTSLFRWGYSADRRSFTGGGWLTMPTDFTCEGDPAVVADDAGFIYMASLACQFGTCYSHIGVVRSTGSTPPYTFGAATLYQTTWNLSGADLFIQPSGAVTGIGPLWQTPDIYVVNAAGDRVNAFKGTVNQLRAHVRNLGNAEANGVTVRFKYAPWFAGLNDSMFKEIGTVNVNFSAGAGASDDQVVPIEWDLTDTADTNRGLWPEPISAFQHFCLTVTVEFSGDIHLSNNFAQNNFADVTDSPETGGAGTDGAGNGGAGNGGMGIDGSPLTFMVVGPEKGQRASLAQLAVNSLPEGFRTNLTVKGVADAMKGFRLKPNETRLAQVTFATPKGFKSTSDVVANITLLLDGKPSGGISALLYRSAEKQPDLSGLASITKAYWEVKSQTTPARPMQKEIPPEPEQLPPVRTIPKPVRYRRTFKANYETVYEAIVKVLREQKLGPELANFERGLINSKAVFVTRSEIAKLVDEKDLRNLRADGYYFCSLWVEPHGDGETEIGVDALIATSEIESLMGLRRRSNGTLERSLLDWIARLLNKP